jgi:hypothetical protein
VQAALWPDGTFVDFEHGLNVAVKKLRAAPCDSPETPRYIETGLSASTGAGKHITGSPHEKEPQG